MTDRHGRGRRRPSDEAARDDAASTRPAETAGETDAPDGASIDGEISGLRDELEHLNGKWLRALADLDNFKKRVERDRCRWSESAREEIVLDLLEVMDNFERALACEDPAGDDGGALREGVELIRRSFSDILRKHGVTPIDTDGSEFDPNLHEAVGQVESETHEANHIVEEMQRGYMLGDRLLRCSKVIVSK